MNVAHAEHEAQPASGAPDESGSIHRLLTLEHQRLDALLEAAGSCATAPQLQAYDEFRRGLLRHIGTEEKILFPMAQRLRAGRPLPEAAKLRLDHGAIVALLTPAPSPAVVRALRAVLAAHNPLEEGPRGVYETCEQLARDAGEAGELARQLREAPQVPTNPNLTNPRVMEAAKRALMRAGYDPALLDEQ